MKSFKFIKYLIINILVILVIITSLEVGVWYFENKRLVQDKDEYVLKNGFFPFHKGMYTFDWNLNNFFTGEPNKGRAPEGLQYKKKKPIVIFGCSYAYGFLLDREQTFSYKLAQLTKRPVYNRAYSAWGSAHMLYQARMRELYRQIPEPEYVIFLSMHDHFRRLYVMTFMSGDILGENFYLRYKEKNGELIQIKNTNKFLNMFKRLYTFQKLHHFYVNNIILKKDDYTNGYDFYFKQLSESKKEMQKHWENTKFVFILYDSLKDEDILLNKLENDGYIVINLPAVVNKNLYDKEYILEKDYHPNEKVWNLVTPIIAKELKL